MTARFIATKDFGEERVILDLSRAEANYLLECLDEHTDGGPVDKGWKTDRFKAFIERIRKEMGDG
jgi:hypothetical protein